MALFFLSILFFFSSFGLSFFEEDGAIKERRFQIGGLVGGIGRRQWEMNGGEESSKIREWDHGGKKKFFF